MCKYPALPLFTDAWVADTCHLTRCERGTYMDLLVLMWRTPGCRVPNDDAWLARHMRMTIAEVQAEVRPLIEEFCQHESRHWIIQKRLRKEFAYISELRPEQARRVNERWKNADDMLDGTEQGRRGRLRKPLNNPNIRDTTLPYPHLLRKKEQNLDLEGKKEPQPAVELAQSAKDAIAAHQARERELAERERRPHRTERGLELTRAWLERKGLPSGMEPLKKAFTNGAEHELPC